MSDTGPITSSPDHRSSGTTNSQHNECTRRRRQDMNGLETDDACYIYVQTPVLGPILPPPPKKKFLLRERNKRRRPFFSIRFKEKNTTTWVSQSVSQSTPSTQSSHLALREEGVNDGGARGHEGRLEHVRQEAQHGVEALPLAALLLHLYKNAAAPEGSRKAGRREKERGGGTTRKSDPGELAAGRLTNVPGERNPANESRAGGMDGWMERRTDGKTDR